MKMEEHLSDSTIMNSPPCTRALRLGWLICNCLLLIGCASKQVVVEGKFPTPLMDPMPITVGVIYPKAFAEHEFFDEAKGRSETDWLVKTGEAQVEFWDKVFHGMFAEVVHIRDWQTVQTRGGDIDGVIIPAISKLEYTIPTHTNVKIYEIWMRYDFRLVDINAIHRQEDGALTVKPDDWIAKWSVTAYGKTPTAFLQTDEEAVNLAAVVALRDAGANFITTFGKTDSRFTNDDLDLESDIGQWLDVVIKDNSLDDSIPPEETKASKLPVSSGTRGTSATQNSAGNLQRGEAEDPVSASTIADEHLP